LAMLLAKLLSLLAGWATAFRQHRTHARAVALALGLLCGLGRRTITRAICFNNRQHQDWGADYKLFNRSRWDTRALFEPVIQGAIAQYCPKHIVIGFDDTGITFVAMVRELRQCFDRHGFQHKSVIADGDGSFCNKTTFRQTFDRTILITRAR